MYKKSVQGWLKHLDFMILDVVCLWISFTLAFNMRHGSLDVLANSLYRDMMWSLALMDIVVIFFFDSLKNVLKRGFYQEFVMTVKQTCLITLCSVFYLFTFKEAENYSRLVLGYTAALYLLISYVLRCLWKNCLRKYFGGAEKRSLLIVTVSDIVDTVIDNIKNKNYGDYFVTGVCILDKKAKGRVIDGVTVVADEDDLVEYVCREWVDEVFINIPESEPYPAELLDKFIEMGVVVHMKLAKSQNLLGKKQFVEHLGTYTVLTTSINSVSRRQIILKRMLDILGGLAGCIITGILCIFVGPAIYIQSPGPIFFKQTRVGKNGKMFQMYKFRSMYMDAEERKAELMKENRVQDGMMFKLDFDPRIIGSKKLPDGTIKKGVGNFIRDWSLDEFPQFLNVLKGDMSLVGTRPPTVDEWDKYELHHRARLATKPGLTGMWQVSGRSNITDFYTAMILLRTVLNREIWFDPLGKIFGGWGLYEDGQFTTESIENFMLFVPFSVLLLWAFQKELLDESENIRFGKTVWKATKVVAVFSFMIEFTQLLFHLGTFQISDLSYNTLGGVAGGIIYYLGYCRKGKRKNKIRNRSVHWNKIPVHVQTRIRFSLLFS